MNSTDSPDTRWLATLSNVDRARFMAKLLHGLSVGQRVLFYDDNLEGARQLNEANHQIAGFLVDALDGRMQRMFGSFLFQLTDAQAGVQFAQAWTSAKATLAADDQEQTLPQP
ncbi:hypothetical protein [Polaromonas sp. YR568]|uniref:hypothetical protein n=1 Tax=Polaromonas sp. YR568 TaxID=1855301 RepID=UPI00398BCC2E